MQGISTKPVLSLSKYSIQAAGDVPLQIQLRYSDGTAVSGESIRLQRLPDGQETTCTTDKNGRCSWTVVRGLYQVIFSQPLDSISALAVAEGGLDGFGLTVGDAPINYEFTFHHDDHVYFDAAPEAAVPDPIIPTADSLHGGVMPTAVGVTAVPSTTVGIAAVTPLSEKDAPSQAIPLSDEADVAALVDVAPPVTPFWRLLLVILLGLALGGGLHLWSRRRQQTAERAAMELRLTTFVSSPQTRGVSASTHSSTGESAC